MDMYMFCLRMTCIYTYINIYFMHTYFMCFIILIHFFHNTQLKISLQVDGSIRQSGGSRNSEPKGTRRVPYGPRSKYLLRRYFGPQILDPFRAFLAADPWMHRGEPL